MADELPKDSPTLSFLRRRKYGHISLPPTGADTFTIYLGVGERHILPYPEYKTKTLKEVIDFVSAKRGNASLSKRVPRDFDDNALSLSSTVEELHAKEIVLLAEQESPALVDRRDTLSPGPASPLLADSVVALLSSKRKESQPRVLSSLAREMSRAIASTTHKVGLRVYNNSFLAFEAIEWLQRSQNVTREQAIAICRTLEKEGFISHVRLRAYFDGDSNLLYRFTELATENTGSPHVGSSSHASSEAFHRIFWRFTESNIDPNNDSKANVQRIFRLASYVPNVVLKQLAAHRGMIIPPLLEEMPAAVLFADISGFTPLTEKLLSVGPRGFEQLTNHLNEYFTSMISIIYNHGGDIVKFAGDALLVIWPTAAEAGLKYSTHVATQCAAALRDQLKTSFEDGGTPLRLHIGVSVGTIACIHIGAHPRIEFAIAGEPLVQAAECEEYAKPGQVFVSEKVSNMLGSAISVKPHTPRGEASRSSVGPQQLIQVIKQAVLCPITAPVHSASILESYAPEAVSSHVASGSRDDFLAEVRTVSVIFINVKLAVDVPTLKAGAAMDKLQRTYDCVQESVSKYEGTIRQFIVDDKGIVFIAAFGLPPTSHEDDPHRAVRAGMTIFEHLRKKEDITASIGITTGKAFCGAVGSDDRREYAMNLSARLMGKAEGRVLCDRTTYNASSSRYTFKTLPPLTVKGKMAPVDVFTPQDELVSASPQLGAKRRDFTYSKKSPGAAPRKRNSMKRQRLSAPPNYFVSANAGLPAMVGRTKEVDTIRRLMMQIQTSLPEQVSSGSDIARGYLLTIEGEFGTGKTRLSLELKSLARLSALSCITGYAYSSDVFVPFTCFKGIVCSAVEITARSEIAPTSPPEEHEAQLDENSSARTSTVLASLKRRLGDAWLPYAPLLRDVIPDLRLSDNETTSQLFGDLRAQKTTEMCIELINASHFDIIVLENAQWMDSRSWYMAQQLVKKWCNRQRLLVVCIRPPAPSDKTSLLAVEYEELLRPATLQSIELTRIQLASFTMVELKQLIANKLGITPAGVPDIVATPIFDCTFGNPLVATELISDLIRKPELVVNNDSCSLVTTNRFSLYRTYEGAESALTAIVTSKIDSLSASDQLVLKVAATVGREFRLDLLHDVLSELSSTPTDSVKLASTLDLLESQGFITPLQTDPPSFAFRLGALPEILYRLMLFSQRKIIHQKIAEWLANNQAIAGSNQTLLAFHWKGAEAWTTALAFMVRCASRAMKQGSFLEAVAMLNDCVGTYKKLDAKEAAEMRNDLASWHRMIGEAWNSMRDYKRAVIHLQEGLAILSLPMPSERTNRVPELLEDLKSRIRRAKKKASSMSSYNGFLWNVASNKEQQALIDAGGREGVAIYGQLTFIKFFSTERAESAFCMLYAIKQAAKLGMTAEYLTLVSQAILTFAGFEMLNLAEDVMSHAEVISRQVLQAQEASEVRLEEHLARYYFCIGAYYSYHGHWPLAMHSFELSTKTAVAASRPAIVAEATLWNLYVTFWKGEFTPKLEDYIAEAIKVADANQDSQLKCITLMVRGALLLAQRHNRTAKKVIQELEDLCTTIGAATGGTSVSQRMRLQTVLPLRVVTLARENSTTELLESTLELLAHLEQVEPINLMGSLSRIHMQPDVSLCEAVSQLQTEDLLTPAMLARVVACLKRFESVFPFMQPVFTMFHAFFEARKNNAEEALNLMHTTVYQAFRRGTRHIYAIAMYSLGDRDAEGAKKAESLLEQQGVDLHKLPRFL